MNNGLRGYIKGNTNPNASEKVEEHWNGCVGVRVKTNILYHPYTKLKDNPVDKTFERKKNDIIRL